MIEHFLDLKSLSIIPNCSFAILQEAISGFYRFIWNLFYAEYMIFPVI